MTQVHAGYEATRRTDGGLFHRIQAAKKRLEAVVLADRTDDWAAAVRAVRYAEELLAEGRRAKAGKILARTNNPIELVI